MPNWQELATTSPYQTAVAVRDALQGGDTQEATCGIEELMNALARSDKRALESHLMRLMQHVLKWQRQPERRSRSWSNTIANAREAIVEIQEETLSLMDAVIRSVWERVLRKAHREAESELGRALPPTSLSWEDVFEQTYDVTPS